MGQSSVRTEGMIGKERGIEGHVGRLRADGRTKKDRTGDFTRKGKRKSTYLVACIDNVSV
jgi:hypothetical protein